MPKAKAVQPADGASAPEGPRPRLSRISIRNFRCISDSPVEIELDDIVILVGPNNVGKSSVLKAYELIMSEGSKEGELAQEDFPDGKIDPEHLPEVELETVVYDNSPGDEWIETRSSGEKVVREKWTWAKPGAPVRRGFNVAEGRWTNDTDKEKVPWGAAGVAKSRRPQPNRVEAFAAPEEQAKQIVKLLMKALDAKVKALQAPTSDGTTNPLSELLKQVAILQKQIVAETAEEISDIENRLSEQVAKVFPQHKVVFDARPEDGLEKAVSFFKGDAQLLMGPENGHLSPLERQGSGARRTLLWTAIRLLAESGAAAKKATQRPFVLLLDEPEICLHPSAIRQACELLYGLPATTGNWQVVVTTHSPCFVDFTRDHTSVVRVDRGANGVVRGTTIFRPSRASFDEDERSLVKLLNVCDPYVAEFFFGGRTVLVEGDTEYAVFKYLASIEPERYGQMHVVRARGKATLVALCKILNQFGASYSLLHDSDLPTYEKDGIQIANPAWATNASILSEASKAEARVRLVASLPNFEEAYFGSSIKSEKPYAALARVKTDPSARERLAALLQALIDPQSDLPPAAVEWASLDELTAKLSAHGVAAT